MGNIVSLVVPMGRIDKINKKIFGRRDYRQPGQNQLSQQITMRIDAQFSPTGTPQS